MKKKRGRPLHTKSPTMALRRQTQRETFARLLLLGWTTEKIARKLKVTPRAIRYAISTPEFEALYAKLQQERYQAVDRKMHALLGGAVDTLEKLLRHPDWKAKSVALEHILRIHGKFIDRIDLTGRVEHTGAFQPHHQGELVDGNSMTDEMRQKAIELLKLQRAMYPPKALPARIASQDSQHHDEHHPMNGRFVPNPEDGS
jgi:hypothetical protein